MEKYEKFYDNFLSSFLGKKNRIIFFNKNKNKDFKYLEIYKFDNKKIKVSFGTTNLLDNIFKSNINKNWDDGLENYLSDKKIILLLIHKLLYFIIF